MGTVTNSIGTASRDYSTISLWEASLPSNLVTNGNSYVGQCYNDSEFLVTAGIVIGTRTTDSTHFITLTTASGQSFRDNAGVQTNALSYNQSNGVGIRTTTSFITVLTVKANFTVLSYLQISDNAASYNTGALSFTSVQNCTIDSCIIQMAPAVNSNTVTQSGNSGLNTWINNLILVAGSGSSANQSGIVVQNQGLNVIVNNTIAIASNITGSGNSYGLTLSGGHYSGLNICTNNAIFGFPAGFCDDITGYGSSSNNASDLVGTTVPGTSNQVSLTYTSQFQVTTTAGADFRAKPAGSLLDNGTTDTTHIPAAIDIVGTSRPQGTAWDIGAWELIQSGPAPTTANIGWATSKW